MTELIDVRIAPTTAAPATSDLDVGYAIVARGLVKHYGDNVALAGIDIEVQAGTVTAVLGPNGAGKTTAVRILTTLTDATAGTATVAGFDVATQGGEVRRRIGLAAQDATVDPLLTGRENLVMLGELHQLGPQGCRRIAPSSCSSSSRSPTPPIVSCRATPAACAAASTSPPRSSPVPRCCSSTSRPPGSTRGRAPSCGRCSTRSSIAAPRCCSRRSTSTRPSASPTTSSSSTAAASSLAATPARSSARSAAITSTSWSSTPARLDQAAAIVAEATGGEPAVDAEARSINAPTTGGVDALVAVATQLRDAGIAVEDLSIRQPTLDDVFLTLTGEPCHDDAEGEGEVKAS